MVLVRALARIEISSVRECARDDDRTKQERLGPNPTHMAPVCGRCAVRGTADGGEHRSWPAGRGRGRGRL